jgi:Tol biopolymer transport system component
MSRSQILEGLFLSTILLSLACRGQDEPSQLTGRYLGQDPPGLTPVLFAPGVVSTEVNELNAAFSPDGNELYFSVRRAGRNTLMKVSVENGRWTERSVVAFSGEYSDVDPFVSADGERLYYSSMRPLTGSGDAKDSDIWYVERREGGDWSEPVNLGTPNGQGPDDYYTSIASDGTLYFSKFESAAAGGDLYRSKLISGEYVEPELIEAPVSTAASEHDPFIAPDGRYLIFTSDRAGGYGESDLYVSFATPDGKWSEPINMGPEINSHGYDFCPMLSPGGAYLFFTRTINGNGDIYWVDAGGVEALRP